MENQMQVEAFPKKVWNVLRIFFFMLRKGVISKRKLMLNLNLFLKRGKTAQKALFSHHSAGLFRAPAGAGEYEFSCSTTPAHHKFLFYKRKQEARFMAHYETVEDEIANMMALNDAVEGSPMLPGLGPRDMGSPALKSPGWARDEGDCHVDEAAEEFIRRFFCQLRRQSLTDA